MIGYRPIWDFRVRVVRFGLNYCFYETRLRRDNRNPLLTWRQYGLIALNGRFRSEAGKHKGRP